MIGLNNSIARYSEFFHDYLVSSSLQVGEFHHEFHGGLLTVE